MMSMVNLRRSLMAALVGLAVSGHTLAATEITFWHSMDGINGEQIDSLVSRFNQSHPDYKVIASLKGDYEQSLANGIAAVRNGKSPDILQVYDLGTATMMYSRAVVPVHQLFKDQGIPFDQKQFLAPVAGYYSDSNGDLASLPFNSSTPVTFYNKDAFKKAGLNPDQAPRTWREVQKDAAALRKAGMTCGYASGAMAVQHIQVYSAWHALPVATKNNGYDGLDSSLVFNNPTVVAHIQMLADMYKAGDMSYYGRKDDAISKFYSGDCGIATVSSGSLTTVRRYAKFDFGVGMMPYDEGVPGAPQNSLVGGASLWVMKGKSPDTYKGVAQFMQFVTQPENAAQWHQKTGYVPVTKAAYELTKQQGFYDANPGADVAAKQLQNKDPLPFTKGVRVGSLQQINTIISEELEKVWAGAAIPQAAMDSAVTRGNEQLRRFELQVK
ncbi:sn-glycerol-3-phosphate ABC transporter substrate-binding protein UgpB [Pseudomonas syringae]|uniref:sn-glycerol-3-phosphate ABC transporter substrate-binding protein UgpB n=1 Tax=Pseudomonas syringae TaxID=317 RepID=UPI000AF9F63E|nr:sn-glycerol-3-phosphate ABC transporter substrate-binding protein UgpB [Pseudomonas syringae]WHN05909.1 sn-glycerol-3-phosphate ABC transporter substrate-binding protein UgpB [Pseudomonas syringae pv. syringae]